MKHILKIFLVVISLCTQAAQLPHALQTVPLIPYNHLKYSFPAHYLERDAHRYNQWFFQKDLCHTKQESGATWNNVINVAHLYNKMMHQVRNDYSNCDDVAIKNSLVIYHDALSRCWKKIYTYAVHQEVKEINENFNQLKYTLPSILNWSYRRTHFTLNTFAAFNFSQAQENKYLSINDQENVMDFILGISLQSCKANELLYCLTRSNYKVCDDCRISSAQVVQDFLSSIHALKALSAVLPHLENSYDCTLVKQASTVAYNFATSVCPNSRDLQLPLKDRFKIGAWCTVLQHYKDFLEKEKNPSLHSPTIGQPLQLIPVFYYEPSYILDGKGLKIHEGYKDKIKSFVEYAHQWFFNFNPLEYNLPTKTIISEQESQRYDSLITLAHIYAQGVRDVTTDLYRISSFDDQKVLQELLNIFKSGWKNLYTCIKILYYYNSCAMSVADYIELDDKEMVEILGSDYKNLDNLLHNFSAFKNQKESKELSCDVKEKLLDFILATNVINSKYTELELQYKASSISHFESHTYLKNFLIDILYGLKMGVKWVKDLNGLKDSLENSAHIFLVDEALKSTHRFAKKAYRTFNLQDFKSHVSLNQRMQSSLYFHLIRHYLQ